jgi:transcriptional regulator with XRE-family HTH domain
MGEIETKLGELLRLERERREISLEDLSLQLKISERNLQCIEAGNVGGLPSPLYFNLFSKSCCEALGIDHARTLEAIRQETLEAQTSSKAETGADADSEADRPRQPSAGRQKAEGGDHSEKTYIKKLIYLFGGIVVVFIAFIVISQIMSDDEGTGNEPAIEERATEEISQPAAEPKQADSSAPYDWDVPEYQKPPALKLRLTPRAESWSTILADGDTAIFRNLIPGRVYDVEAAYRLQISVGIPSMVDIELNGQPLDLVDPETKLISRVIIDQMNLAEFLNPSGKPAESTLQTLPDTAVGSGAIDRPADNTSPAVSGEEADGV